MVTYDLVPGDTYSIQYCDAEGEYSAREIRVIEVERDYVRAFCYRRMEPRTFRLDRTMSPVLLCNEVAEALRVNALNAAPMESPLPNVARIPDVWRDSISFR